MSSETSVIVWHQRFNSRVSRRWAAGELLNDVSIRIRVEHDSREQLQQIKAVQLAGLLSCPQAIPGACTKRASCSSDKDGQYILFRML